MKRQNKLGIYLTLTAGVGCVSSTSAAIQVVDLSGVNFSDGTLTIPNGDAAFDVSMINSSADGSGYLISNLPNATFYSDSASETYSGDARVYLQAANNNVDFGSTSFNYAGWAGSSESTTAGVGTNWIAFKDTDDRYGWLSIELNALSVNSTNPVTGFGHFVYDDASTGPSDAISLQQAIDASSVPEPSSLALLALGAAGLVTRRNRKLAA